MTIQELLNAAQKLSLADQLQLASQLMQTASQQLKTSSVFSTQSAESESTAPTKDDLADDPLVGLFAGSPDLATQSEEILSQAVKPASGFTWKA